MSEYQHDFFDDDEDTGVFWAPAPSDTVQTSAPRPRTAAGSAPRPRPPRPHADSEARTGIDDGVAVLSLVRRIALQTDLAGTLKVLERGVAELAGASRVRCLAADPLTGMPWAAGVGETSLAALAASHRQQLAAQPVRRCPLWCPEVDDPEGCGDESVIAQPLGAANTVVAVLLVARDSQLPIYGQREAMLLASLAQQCGPLVVSAVHAAAQREMVAGDGNPLFREQALDRYRDSRRDGALLNISPRWVSRVYPMILVAFAAALAYGMFASVNQYSAGAAFIEYEGTEVTARAAGTVASTHVVANQRVKKGDLLVRMHADAEDANLTEINLEYERELGSFLFDPSNQSAKQNLASIAARKQKADKVLENRSIRAPRDGVVTDLRVSEGQRLELGDRIATVVAPDALPTLVAFLPGHDRPRLRPGMTIQFKLPGFEKTNEKAVITSVGREVIGAAEAKRYSGQQIADALAVKGSLVLVRARLDRRTYTARDKTYAFADGQIARAEVAVRTRRVLAALVPALEKYLP